MAATERKFKVNEKMMLSLSEREKNNRILKKTA
jgi:hypothetical protein